MAIIIIAERIITLELKFNMKEFTDMMKKLYQSMTDLKKHVSQKHVWRFYSILTSRDLGR